MSLDSILRSVGKNLFDKSTLTAGSSVVEFTQTANGFTFKTAATQKTMLVGSNIYLIAGTYYCSGTVTCSDTSYKGGWAVYDNETGKFIINASSRGTINDKFTITESKTYQLNFYAPYNAPVGVIMTFENVQLEKGSTATTYEPYEHLGPKTIKIPSNGENLTPYPYADNDKTENGITFVTGNYSGIRMNGTMSSDLPIGFTIVDNLDLTAGDYTFSSGYNGTVIPNDVVVQLNYLEGNIPKGVATLSGSKLQETFSIDDTLAQKKFRATIVLNTEMSSSFSVNDLLLCPTLVKFGIKEVLKVSYNSRNLFDINNVYSPLNTDTYEISDNKLKVYRNRTYVVGVIYRIPLPVGTQYTLYYDIEYGGTATGIYNCADSKIFNGSLNKVNYTGTVGDTGYLKLEFSRIGGENDKLGWVIYSNIQVELGNKKTDYVPYFNTVVWEKQEIVATNKLGSFKLGESVLA